MLFFSSGETTLEELINSLEGNPDILLRTYFDGIEKISGTIETQKKDDETFVDTGETIMHLLAKEGCIEPLRKILDLDDHPKIEASKLVLSLLKHDVAGWSPLMSVLKADRNVEEIIKLFLNFLEGHADSNDVEEMLKMPNVSFLKFGIQLHNHRKTLETFYREF